MLFNFKESIIDKLAPADLEDIKKKYLTHSIKDIISDEEYLNTITEFFNNNLNVSLTSEKTFMHRNTLNYRLDKIFHETGLNIKNFNEALLLKVLIEINLKENENKKSDN